MDRYDQLFLGALVLTVLGITAAWWLARTVKRLRWASWSWWIAVAPMILAAGAVTALLTPS
ncbi:hypothetical protein [Tomitella biformata]|uniref:hypothetical protein n=1 Tax=Tomitella biformata TaxID=630403 RepID=UPI000464BA10|nr:hypothetical protein [Tomitella biformata]